MLTTVRYSNSKRPKKQWRLPLHLLTNPATADEIRAIIKRGLAASPGKPEPPIRPHFLRPTRTISVTYFLMVPFLTPAVDCTGTVL